MKLAVGPILYYWPRQTVFSFYRALAHMPVELVYLGETVCSRRHELRLDDWLELADTLALANKKVVLSTPVLIESESDLRALRRIACNGRHVVEANDMGAVRLLAGGGPFVAGSALNIYNRDTLWFLSGLGAQRWVAPVEISRASLAVLQQERPVGMETEVFAYGRLPLAHSARCFTARRLNLQKDDCQFRCLDFPEGLPARTREHEPFLVLNGVQTQSASVCNLIREIPAMAQLGIDVLRVSPTYAHACDIIELFKHAIDHPDELEQAARELARIAPEATCDGYWHGRPGMHAVGASALLH
jgi:O2-independent ubiquinone biosynthesis protein UbiV